MDALFYDKSSYDEFEATIRQLGLTEAQVTAMVNAAKTILESDMGSGKARRTKSR